MFLLVGRLQPEDMHSACMSYINMIPLVPYTMLQPGLLTDIIHVMLPLMPDRTNERCHALSVVSQVLEHGAEPQEVTECLLERSVAMDDTVCGFLLRHVERPLAAALGF